MRRLAFLALLGAALAGPSAAQDAGQAQRLAAAHELVTATGLPTVIDATLLRMREVMIGTIRRTSPRLSDAQLAEIVDQYLMPEFRARSGEITEATVAIYAGRLSAEEMRELIAFYRSPIGVKLVAITPEITAESTRFGQEWGSRVAQDAFAKHRAALRARGIEL